MAAAVLGQLQGVLVVGPPVPVFLLVGDAAETLQGNVDHLDRAEAHRGLLPPLRGPARLHDPLQGRLEDHALFQGFRPEVRVLGLEPVDLQAGHAELPAVGIDQARGRQLAQRDGERPSQVERRLNALRPHVVFHQRVAGEEAAPREIGDGVVLLVLAPEPAQRGLVAVAAHRVFERQVLALVLPVAELPENPLVAPHLGQEGGRHPIQLGRHLGDPATEGLFGNDLGVFLRPLAEGRPQRSEQLVRTGREERPEFREVRRLGAVVLAAVFGFRSENTCCRTSGSLRMENPGTRTSPAIMAGGWP